MSKNIFSLPTIMFTTRDIDDPGETDAPGNGSGEGTPHVPMLNYSEWLASDYATDLYGSDGVTNFNDYRVWFQQYFPFFAWVDLYGKGVSWNPGDAIPPEYNP